MLFFFEVGFLVLAIVTLLIAETVSRAAALGLWGLVSLTSLLASQLVGARLRRQPASDRADELWRRHLADGWRHLNKLLLIGLAGLVAWSWLVR